MAAVLAALVPVALVVALGLALKQRMLREPGHWHALEQLTYYVLFPALLVVSAIRADLSKVNFVGVVGAFGLTLIGLAAALVAVAPLLRRTMGMDGPAFTSLFQGALRWNTYISFAVADGLFGAAGVTIAAVALACLIPLANVLAVGALSRYAATARPQPLQVAWQLARNPLIWSCAVGMAINVGGIPMPKVLLEFADILGRASLAVGLLVVGAGLSPRSLVRPRGASLLAVLLCLLVKPALTMALGLAFGLRGMELSVTTLLAAVPSSPAGYVLARQMGGDAPLLAEILTLQILAAAITLPLVVFAATMLGG